ncbi:MAG: acyltransferase [Spirochaetales bacterium]
MKKLSGADGLRALACLMVIAHHLGQRLNFQHPGDDWAFWGGMVQTGAAGVAVFFVLSGFLLSAPFWRAYATGAALPSLRQYTVRRAGRIMPAFYVILLVSYLASVAFLPGEPALFWRYLAGLTFTSGFHWATLFPTGITGPLWSVGFEVVSYALLPLAMVGLFAVAGQTRGRPRALGWWLLVLVAVFGVNQLLLDALRSNALGNGWQYGLVGGAKYWMPRYNPVGFFAQFSMGILGCGLATVWSRDERFALWKRRGVFDALAVLLLLGFLAILVSQGGARDFSLSFQHQPYYFPLFAGTTGLLLACLTQSRWLGKAFDNPVSRYVAQVSYGLYLWHFFVIEVLSATVFPHLTHGGMPNLTEWLVASAVVLVVSFALATASWYLLERPLLRAAQAWHPRAAGTPYRPGWRTTTMVAVAVALVAVPTAVALANPFTLEFPSPWFS